MLKALISWFSIIFLLCTWYGCGIHVRQPKVDISIKLNELRSTFDKDGSLSFDLFDLYPNHADTIIVVEPYCPVVEFERTEVVNIKDVMPVLRTIESSDYYCLLFWVSNNSIIAYSLFDRQPIDFTYLPEDDLPIKFFNRDNSMVEVHLNEHDYTKHVFVKSTF